MTTKEDVLIWFKETTMIEILEVAMKLESIIKERVKESG